MTPQEFEIILNQIDDVVFKGYETSLYKTFVKYLMGEDYTKLGGDHKRFPIPQSLEYYFKDTPKERLIHNAFYWSATEFDRETWEQIDNMYQEIIKQS